jgi:hypothetical protein
MNNATKSIMAIFSSIKSGPFTLFLIFCFFCLVVHKFDLSYF